MEQRNSRSNLHERRFPKEQNGTGKPYRKPAPLLTDISARYSALKTQQTPPETPMSLDSRRPQSAKSALFHNYLRAFVQFEPPAHVGKNAQSLQGTVPLEAGDLILIHSVHANGWADGTVLSTGLRGWLPTNYCETFDHPAMRHLLTAMTQFWDLLGVGADANFSSFVRQDYIRPLIAGVRYLLERAGCLHRDAVLVQRSSGLRRLRKGLLSDLSILVQISKRLQDVVGESFAEEVVPMLLDDMMSRAFKVVTRAVGFVDMLAQEKAPGQSSQDINDHEPNSTLPADVRNSSYEPTSLTGSRPIDSAKGFPDGLDGQVNSTKAALSFQSTPPRTKRSSGFVTHRLSMLKPEHPQSKTLASEQLAKAHDAFISHIGSFIGLYLHSSRPASELALTTEHLISACKVLLDIVDKVSIYEPQGKDTVQQARAGFQLKLDELTKSTKDVFTHCLHEDNDVVMLPEQTSRLIEQGTGLIRTVGDCVVKTRKVIEQIGDFDLENPPITEKEFDEEEQVTGSSAETETPETKLGLLPVLSEPDLASMGTGSHHRSSEQEIPEATDVQDFENESSVPESPSKTAPEEHTPSLLPPSAPPPPPPIIEAAHASTSTEAPKSLENVNAESISPDRKDSVGASIAGSTDTKKSLRDSGFTNISDGSTRATTPEHAKESSVDTKLTTSFGSLASLRSAANMDESMDAEAQLLQKSFANELILNKDGQVTGGSLPALVEQLTLGDIAPDPQFVAAFFVTFRSFTTARELAQALIYRFDYIGNSKSVGVPVRLRVYNVFKGWLETYWNAETDRAALGDIRYFALHKLKPNLATAGERLVEVTRKISGQYHTGAMAGPLVSGVGKTATSIGHQNDGENTAPDPIITKNQLTALRNAVAGSASACTVVDFDPLEVARQMTILSSNIFCEIKPDELLSLEWNKKDSTKAENVRNMCILNTDVAHVVGDTILAPEDAKKRAFVIKHWSKVAMRCLELNNYETLMAIMCSLNSSVVQRLKRTWEVVSKKTKARLAELNTVVDFSRNQASLRRRLEKPVAPCLPFLGIYLTDLTMIDAGNPKLRELPGTTSESGDTLSVINFDKHMRMAKIVSHVQKFQVRYKLKQVPEMQQWMHMHLERMREGHAQMVGTFHRRSLVIEPIADIKDVTRPTKPAEAKRADESTIVSEPRTTATEGRPKTAGSVHPTVKSLKPHGPTFEFLLKTNLHFKSRPDMPAKPDAPSPQ